MIRFTVRYVPFLVTAIASILLAGCGTQGSGDDIGGVSASEAQALNDAADMLDNRAAPPLATAKTAP